MALLIAIRLILSLPFFALTNGFDWLAHRISGIGRVVTVEITSHPHLGYGVISSNMSRNGRWHESLEQAETAARFIINEVVEAELDRAETPVRRETA